jgi:hypothetical protein
MSILAGKNIVVYDLEIKKPIEECSNGWASHDEMGISVGCAFDYREMRYKIFMDDNMQLLVDRLNELGTIVVAFNHISFDNKLLRASRYNLKQDTELSNYDMLIESREAAGTKGMIKGFKLDDHLRALHLPMKTANGALAPKMYQEGKIGELTDYCLNDVTQEKTLFEYIVKNQRLACEYKPDGFEVRLPLYVLRQIFKVK